MPEDDQAFSYREAAQGDDEPLSYCARNCLGVPIPPEMMATEETPECPICFETIETTPMSVMNVCGHVLCDGCAGRLIKQRGCPLCLRECEVVMRVDHPIQRACMKQLIEKHSDCYLGNCPYLKEYCGLLSGAWLQLVAFLLETKLEGGQYYRGLRGIEHLKLRKYEKEGRLVTSGKAHAVVLAKSGRTQVIVCGLLPSMSLRVMITKGDDYGFEVDNDYADEVARFTNCQLRACWRVFPQLVNRADVQHAYVRRFQEVTCTLFMSGVNEAGHLDHNMPMKDELAKLKKCNFDPAHFKALRSDFPAIFKYKAYMPIYYKGNSCCNCLPHMEDSDGTREEEEFSETDEEGNQASADTK